MADGPVFAERTLAAPIERVRSALRTVLEEEKCTVSGRQSSDSFTANRRRFVRSMADETDAENELKRIGKLGEAHILRVPRGAEYNVAYNVELRAAGPQATRVSISTQITVMMRARRGIPQLYAVTSRGILEAELLDELARRLGLPAAGPESPPIPPSSRAS